MNIKNKIDFQTLIYFFIATYPIFDIKLFYNNITTLIRCIIVTGMFVYTLATIKESRKYLKFIFLYFSILGLYVLFHHLNAMNFKSLVPGNFNYSFFLELMAIWKMSIPALFLYIIYYCRLNLKACYYCLQSWIIIICGSIIVTNLCNISYGSYSDQLISGNVITWFTEKNSNYYNLASKGFFMHPNQISGILLMIIPWNLYFLFKQRKVTDLVLSILIFITSFMIGTKVIGFGVLLSIILYFFMYLFFTLFRKEFDFSKIIFSSAPIMCICFLIILPYSPMTQRVESFNEIEQNEIKTDYSSNEKVLEEETPKQNTHSSVVANNNKLEYIEANIIDKRIHTTFILQCYPYKYDPDFWMDIMKKPLETRLDYRYLEQAMVQRVMTLNDNKLDTLFGLTNTRVQNIFNIERDFVLQYYAFGVVGIFLFFFPYMIGIIYSLRKICKKFNLYNSIGLCSILVYFAAALTSGNMMNHVSTTIPFCFIIGFMFVNQSDDQSKSVRKNNYSIQRKNNYE